MNRYVTNVFAVAIGLFALAGAVIICAPEKPVKKAELAHPFYWAAPDPLRGDWQGEGGYVAQVIRADDRVLSVADQIPQAADAGKYQANIFRKFDVPNDQPVAVLQGTASGNTVTFTGDGWTAEIADGHFKGRKNADAFNLQHVTRTPPSLG